MKRVTILFLVAMLISCRERPARSPGSANTAAPASPSGASASITPASDASASAVFASMQQLKDVRIGSIHNRIMGLEGDIPNGPISANELTLGALQQSLEVRLTKETRINQGVRITARADQTEYSMEVERDAISVAGHDETVFGFYFSVPFENKPWSHSVNWRLKVYTGKEIVVEKELPVPAKELIIYTKTTDNPFDVIDITHLAKGQTYKLFYQNLHSDLLIAYYTSDYSTYAPFYAGKADSHTDLHSAPEITISADALPGAYFFTHKAREAISRDDQAFPVFGYKVID
jgi:hypothetical protein